jgi:excisionase family DNA binding protein
MFTEPFLTAKDIAKMLKISNALAYRLIQNGQIPGVRFGRTVRVSMQSLDQFLQEHSDKIQAPLSGIKGGSYE